MKNYEKRKKNFFLFAILNEFVGLFQLSVLWETPRRASISLVALVPWVQSFGLLSVFFLVKQGFLLSDTLVQVSES